MPTCFHAESELVPFVNHKRAYTPSHPREVVPDFTALTGYGDRMEMVSLACRKQLNEQNQITWRSFFILVKN